MTRKIAGKAKSKKNKNKLLQLLILILVIAGVGFLAYSGFAYEGSQEEQEGFFICNDEGTECELSQHIHADIEVNVCGEDIVFLRETGRTDEMHTHKEKNYMHWHARLKVDPETREPLGSDKSRTTIQAFFNQVEFTLPESCTNNPNPELTVTVNEQEVPEGLDYTWFDGDNIVVDYN